MYLYSTFFFFSWYSDDRDLHSFPTRRSSDLAAVASATPLKRRKPRVFDKAEVPKRWVTLKRGAPGRPRRVVRSEEHTSELQSQFHLVCRLLLEKKNASPNVAIT